MKDHEITTESQLELLDKIYEDMKAAIIDGRPSFCAFITAESKNDKPGAMVIATTGRVACHANQSMIRTLIVDIDKSYNLSNLQIPQN